MGIKAWSCFIVRANRVRVYCFLDINECKEDTGLCNGTNAMCVNQKGGYKCICIPGYQGDGYNCTGKRFCLQT